MQPFQQRVIDEADELGERLCKLDTFIRGSVFQKLEEAERIRLSMQSIVMTDYLGILNERIKAFEGS